MSLSRRVHRKLTAASLSIGEAVQRKIRVDESEKSIHKALLSLLVAGGFASTTLILPLIPIFTESVQASAFKSATLDPTFVQRLKTTRLSTADYKRLVCSFYLEVNIGAVQPQNVCNFLSNLPQFYNNQAVQFYAIYNCDRSLKVVVGNLFYASGDNTQNMDGFPPSDSGVYTSTIQICDNTAIPAFKVANGSNIDDANSSRTYNVIPYHSVSASSSYAANDNPYHPQSQMYFSVVRTGPPAESNQPADLTYQVGGNAVYGQDYSISSTGQANAPVGNFHFSAGNRLESYAFTAATNESNHPEQNVAIQLQVPAGYGSLYAYTQGTILAVDKPQINVSLAAGGSNTLAEGANPGFRFSRVGGSATYLNKTLVVNYTVQGSALNGTDYSYLPGTATIPAGQGFVDVPITVPVRSGSQDVPPKDILVIAQAGTEYYGSTDNNESFTIPAYVASNTSVSLVPPASTTVARGSNTTLRVQRSNTTNDYSLATAVVLSTSGTATNGSDYTIPSSVTIPAGQTFVDVPITFSVPATDQPAETLTVAVQAASGYTPTGQPVTYDLPAYTVPSDVTITNTSGGTLSRPGSSSITITRSGGDTTKDLPVTISTAGTATSGQDYNPIPTTVTIPAGQNSITVPVTAIASTADQPAEDLQVQVQPGTGYAPNSTAGTTTFNLPAYQQSRVTVSGNGATTLTRGQSGSFAVTRTGDTTAALPVSLTIAGTATSGQDYTAIPATVTIPAGQTSLAVPVDSIQPTTAQPSESIDISVAPGQNYVASNPPISYTLSPYTNPALTITPSNGGTAQSGSSNGFTVSRPAGNTAQPLTINYTLGGSATPGIDYTTPGNNAPTGTITIPAGQTTASLPITIPDPSGSTDKPAKDITFTVNPGTGYDSTASQPGTLTIPAYTAPRPTLSVTPSGGGTVDRGTTGNFTLSRPAGSDTSQPLPVNYTLSGTAQPGSDYTAPNGSNGTTGIATIPAGETEVTVPIAVPAASGNTADPAKDSTLTIAPGAGYTVGTPAPASTLNIPAYSPASPSVSVTPTAAGDTTLKPGDTKTVTVTRTGDTSQPLTINLTPGGTALPGSEVDSIPNTVTIPAGQTSATVLVHVPNSVGADSDGKTVSLGVAPGTGYNAPTGNGITYTIAVPPTAIATPQRTTLVPTLDTANPANPSFVLSTSDGKPSTNPVTISYKIGGTAGNGERDVRSGTVTLPAGEAHTSVPIRLTNDAIKGHTVTATFSDGSGKTTFTPDHLTYTIAQNGSNVGQANNAELPTVGVNTAGATGNNRDLVFTVTRNGASKTNPLRVDYEVLGTAIAGVDYETLPGNINIPAGQDSAQIHVKLLKSPSEMGGRTIAIRDQRSSKAMVDHLKAARLIEWAAMEMQPRA